MELFELDIQDLARFFAKRFPFEDQRTRLARIARISEPGVAYPDPVQAWAAVLVASQSAGTLYRLANAAGRAYPDDENLQSVCALLLRKRTRSGRTMAAAACATLVAGAAAAATLVNPVPTTPDTPDTPDTPIIIETAHEEPDVLPPVETASEAPPALSIVTEPTELDDTPIVLAALTVPTPETPQLSSPPDALPPETSGYPAMSDGRCTTQSGELVGYWFAGNSSPGVAGETVTLSTSINVRRDYPNQSNGYGLSTVQCFLTVGDRVLLREAPIAVPPDVWWIPLYSGDLVGG